MRSASSGDLRRFCTTTSSHPIIKRVAFLVSDLESSWMSSWALTPKEYVRACKSSGTTHKPTPFQHLNGDGGWTRGMEDSSRFTLGGTIDVQRGPRNQIARDCE